MVPKSARESERPVAVPSSFFVTAFDVEQLLRLSDRDFRYGEQTTTARNFLTASNFPSALNYDSQVA